MQQGGELMLPEGTAVPDSKLAVQSDGTSFSQLARASDLAAVQLGVDLRECLLSRPFASTNSSPCV